MQGREPHMPKTSTAIAKKYHRNTRRFSGFMMMLPIRATITPPRAINVCVHVALTSRLSWLRLNLSMRLPNANKDMTDKKAMA